MGNRVESMFSSILDIEDMYSPEKQRENTARAVKTAIERGATVEVLMHAFNTDQLRTALSYFNVRGRSNLTRIKDMSIALISSLREKDGTKYEMIGTTTNDVIIDLRKKLALSEQVNANLTIELNAYKLRCKELERELSDASKSKKKKKKFKSSGTIRIDV